MSAEKQTEKNLLNLAMDYMDAPELHLSGDDSARSKSVSGSFRLIDKHLPALQQGEYKITVHQKVEGDGISDGNTFSATQTIQVAAPSVKLLPSDVFSVFPPNDSTGDHSNYLPHLVLNRSTLPWEKESFDKNKNTPWLALVVLDETEFDNTTAIKPGDEIELDTDLISKDNLADLTHVIQRMDASEKAVLIANRLPRPNATSMVHLIALDAETCPDAVIPKGKHHFKSLFSWRFACQKASKNFDGVLANLSTGLLKLPTTSHEQHNQIFAKGFVPLPHFMRLGSQSISWYRSPLVPAQNIKAPKIDTINASDNLYRYDKASKMLDVTYGAAWELGRMLTLKEKDVATAIYNYKRATAQSNKQNQQEILELFNTNEESSNLPNDIKIWLNNLLFLKPIPFNYLVPYEQMLPSESLRFFMLDKKWVHALLDGAMSIGRIFDKKTDAQRKDEEIQLTWSGFILRSEVVANYPDLEVAADNNFPVQIKKVGSDILFCLFKDVTIQEIEFYLKPEGIQFGFEASNNAYQLRLKNENGTPSDQVIGINLANRIVNFEGLKSSVIKNNNNKTLNSANLALQLMTSPLRVRFKVKK